MAEGIRVGRVRSVPAWRWLLVAMLCASAGVAVLAESPALGIEKVVAKEIRDRGAPELVRSVRRLDGVGGDALSQALAGAVLERARGRSTRVENGLVRALGRGDGEPALRAAALLMLAELDLAPGSEAMLASSEDPLFAFARARLLARDERCDEALSLISEQRAALPEEAAARVLGARALASCGQHATALALLAVGEESLDEESLDPRVALEAGQLLLELGDDDSASLWCHAATRSGAGLPSVEHPAALCAASADALRGLLPGGRDAYLDALAAMFADAALSARERVAAGLSGAWVSLGPRKPAGAQRALTLLDQADALRASNGQRRKSALLRAMAQLTLERSTPARRVLARRRSASADVDETVLSAVGRAWLAARSNDIVRASASLGEGYTAAQRAGRHDLLALVEFERAQFYRWVDRSPMAVRYAELALSNWESVRAQPSTRPLLDPCLPRRATELAIEEAGSRTGPAEARQRQMLRQAEVMRGLYDAGALDIEDGVDVGAARRLLAARNASLLYYALGESRSWVWLLEPGALRLVELPPGSELAERLGALSRGELAESGIPLGATTLLGGLLDIHVQDSAVTLSPDGFLCGVPWGLIPVAGRPLADSYPLSIVASLASVADPWGARRAAHGGERDLLFVTRRGGARARGMPAQGGLGTPFRSVTVLASSERAPAELVQLARRGPSILHLSLPLLASGRGRGALHFGWPGGEPTERFLPTLEAAELSSPGIRSELVVLSSEDGWSRAAASRARAGLHLSHRTARAVVVPLGPVSEGVGAQLWPVYYRLLSLGRSKLAAIREAVAQLPRGMAPPVQVVGHADTLVFRSRNESWPFWASIGGAVGILAICLFRLIWKRKDPFDVEPPEE